jgi:hypothetical protein
MFYVTLLLRSICPPDFMCKCSLDIVVLVMWFVFSTVCIIQVMYLIM